MDHIQTSARVVLSNQMLYSVAILIVFKSKSLQMILKFAMVWDQKQPYTSFVPCILQ